MALFSYDNETTLPRMVEGAGDFNTGQPRMEANGGFRGVSGLEAVRVWVWRALCGRPCWGAPISRAWSGLSLPGKGRG